MAQQDRLGFFSLMLTETEGKSGELED